MPRSLLRSFCSRAAAVVAAVATLAAAGCVGSTDATAPAGGPSTSRVALAASVGPVAQVSGSAVTLRVAIAYLHAAGDSVPIGVQTFTLTDAGTQQLPITVDLASCLNDRARRGADLGSGANGACVLRLDLTLLQGTTVLDRQAVVPVLARPGQTTTPAGGQVALYTVASITITPPAGTPAGGPVRAIVGQPFTLPVSAADAAGQPVPARAPVFTTDAPAIATVDSSTGVVTPIAPGHATITASLGGRSASIAVVVVQAPAVVSIAVAGGLGSGTVTSLPAGINCQVVAGVASGPCAFTFAGDVAVTLTATPATGSSFASWGGDCATAGTVLTCTLTPSLTGSGARSATVTFVAFRALGVTLAGDGDGTVTSQPAGINCQLTAAANGSTGGGTTSGTCSAPFLDGNTVTLTASPSAASSFAGWTGACATAAPTCTVTLNQAQTVTATFVRRQATLTLAVSGSGAGTVTATGAGVLGNGACVLAAGAGSTTCTIPVQVGTAVTLTATAGTASSFAGWAGACAAATGTTCSLTVTADASAGAVFTRLPVALTVSAAAGNAGAGSVATADNAIACAIGGATINGTCSAAIAVGAAVTLRATPAQGQIFLGWGGACAASGSATTCTLTLTAASSATVAFGPPQTLTLTLGGTGGGTVTGAGQPCTVGTGAGPVSCTPAVTFNSVVTLAATADSVSTFAGWGGACAANGTASTCVVTLDQARSVTATFQRRTAVITLALSGSSGGNVLRSGVTVCTLGSSGGSTTCQLTVAIGTTVSFTTQPVASGQFNGWAGPCTGTGPCTFTVVGDVTLGATFVPVPVSLTVSADALGTGGGSVTSAPAGISCTIVAANASGTCATSVPSGSQVILTATASANNTFVAWGGACTGQTTTTCTLATINAATSVTARFAANTATLTVLAGSTGGRGSVVSNDGRIACQIDGTATSGTCTGGYTLPATVVLRTTSGTFDQFVSWAGATCQEGNTSSTCTLNLCVPTSVVCTVGASPAAGSISANFRALPPVVVTPSASGTGSGTLTMTSPVVFSCTLAPGGSPGACQFTAPQGVPVTITVTPDASTASFVYGGACAGQTGTTCTFTAATGNNPTVTYTPRAYQLILDPSSDGTGSGTLTTPAPPGGVALNCFYRLPNNPRPSGLCAQNYPAGSTVTITATPDTGSGVVQWTGACADVSASSSTCTLTMNQARTAGAVFGGPYTVGVSAPGTASPSTGGGTVSGTGSIACNYAAGGVTSGTCSASYAFGTTIAYTAVPNGSSFFAGWEAPASYCVGTTASACSFTPTQSGNAVARFSAARIFELDAGDPNSSATLGTVLVQTRGVPDQVFNATALNARNPRFGDGNTVTLTARPAAGASFRGWQGDCQAYGTNPVCTLTNYQPVAASSAPTSGIVQAYFS